MKNTLTEAKICGTIDIENKNKTNENTSEHCFIVTRIYYIWKCGIRRQKTIVSPTWDIEAHFSYKKLC
jgi:hypothetical protein